MDSTPSGLSVTPLRFVHVGVLALSADRVVQSADDATARMCGASVRPEALVGKRIEETFQPVAPEDAAALHGALPVTYLGVVPQVSAHVLVHVMRLPHRSQPDELVATVTSINEYLAESQALARVQLRNTVESIIAGFAHEVRNPLASILSLTEAALQADPAHDTVLVRIPSLVARVESLIQHALAYSRPKPPKRSLHNTSFLLEHAVSLLRAREAPARLQLPERELATPVLVDASQAEQVLVNLIENALDAAASVVQLNVRAGKTPAPSVCIEVSDDGAGVPAEIAERIFDPFFTTKAHGTGLGLAIARDLARLNGGDLRHNPTKRRGAMFQLYLPSTPAAVRGNW
ncbi:MAG: ATP-binding protein [Archangium sp.]|nr:ATP-binding protein [Archangium sp.]